MLAQQDDRLSYEVEKAIGQLPGVRIWDLKVNVDKGRARITGVVPTLADKQAAMDVAMSINGIVAVDEAIAVETPHPPRDADLTRDLGEALDDEQEVDALSVGAQAVRGQAHLKGEAESVRELGYTITTAGEVPDTVSVIDSSRIANPHGPDQIDLVNAAAEVLGMHPTLKSRQIRPVLEDTGKLLLLGQVRADEEKGEAVRTVAGVPGVHTVREELEVIP